MSSLTFGLTAVLPPATPTNAKGTQELTPPSF